jgi:hypothetical protein
MRAKPAADRVRREKLYARSSHIPKPHAEPVPELIDVATAPLGTLGGLEDSLIEAIVDRLLPVGGRIESRLWNQGGVCSGPDGADK